MFLYSYRYIMVYLFIIIILVVLLTNLQKLYIQIEKMSQVQMKSISQRGSELTNRYMVNATLPSSKRVTHDSICCMLFMLFIVVLVASLTLGVKQANFNQFLYPLGQSFKCGYGAAENFTYAYFYNPLVNNRTVCIHRCPKMTANSAIQPISCYFNFRCNYQTTLTPQSEYSPTLQSLSVIGYPTTPTVGKVCLPLPSVMAKSLKPSSLSLYQKITEQHQFVSVNDILNRYYLYIVCAFVAILLSCVFHFFIRNFQFDKLIYPALGFTALIFLLVSFGFFYMAGVFPVPQQNYIGYLGLSYSHLQSRYLGQAITFLLLGIFFIIGLALQIHRTKNSIKPPNTFSSDNAPNFTLNEFFVYLIFLLLFLTHCSLCIYAYICLITSNTMQSTQNSLKMFTQIVPDFSIQKLLAGLVIFWAVWGGSGIIGMAKCVICLVFSENMSVNKINKFKIVDFFIVVVYHHLGSIAASSFFVPSIGRMCQLLLWGLKININQITLANFPARILKICSPGTYVYIAISGLNYLGSSRRAHEITWQLEDKQFQSYKYRIQTQKLMCSGFKLIASFICPLVLLYSFAFNRELRASIFQPLWIFVPSLMFGYGISQIILYGLEEQTRIRQINQILGKQMEGKEQEELVEKEDVKEENRAPSRDSKTRQNNRTRDMNRSTQKIYVQQVVQPMQQAYQNPVKVTPKQKNK